MSSGPRIGELFSGYGGLGLGVQAVYGGTVAWHSDIDKGALKILAHRYPGVPNLGDITTVDWSSVEPVDILTGGSPCQDLSHAGRRAGMTEGTRSNLWVAMREAVAQLRPAVVVWENVRGAYSAPATSELEPCAGCVGDGSGLHLRALGRVLGDLADLGYDASWHGLRAADVGAPHGRLRVFVVARDASSHDERDDRLAGDDRPGRDEEPARAASRTPPDTGRERQSGHGGGRPEGQGLRIAAAGHGDPSRSAGAHLAWSEDDEELDAPTDAGSLRRRARGPAGSGEEEGRRALGDVAGRGLLPTPRATDGTNGGPNQRGSSGDLMLPSAVALLPTPRVGADRTSRSAAVRQDSMSGPSLGQAVEIARGDLPREFTDWDELPESWKKTGALLPTPTVQHSARNSTAGRSPDAKPHADGDTLADLVYDGERWGDYAEAIARWEHALGRPAPAPTMTSTKGNPQLSPVFVEWLMGLPAGWVTDVPGITRNEALKALGNGVVPQQAAEALRVMAEWTAVA